MSTQVDLQRKFDKIFRKVANDNDYSFLYDDKHVKDNIMYATLGGSLGYGTDNENSDIDLRGIIYPLKNEILGLSEYEQFENKQTDTVLYEFRKFVRLAMNANPNVIELLGTREEQVMIMTQEAKILRDNIDLFLTQKAAYSFSGYANNQLRRLQNALARDQYPQAEKEIHIMKSIENQLHHFENHYTSMVDSGSIKLFIDDSDKDEFDKEIFLNIEMNHYPLRDLKNIFSEMSNVVKEYGKLNKRNKKKTEAGLSKHAMHLVRLYKMGTEILSGQGVNTYREHDREQLLEIRNGKYQNDDTTFTTEFYEFVDVLEKEFEYAKKHTTLPVKPDFKKIEELVVAVNESRLSL